MNESRSADSGVPAVGAEGKSWLLAAQVLASWLDRGDRIDTLMEGLPSQLGGAVRARCQHLVFGVVRHRGRIASLLDDLVAHPPRFITRAVLCISSFELIEAWSDADEPGLKARIIHHAVERTKELASPAEARLVNAVARKVADAVSAQLPPGPIAPPAALASYFSHPEWMVRRWLLDLGASATRALLEWNQTPAEAHARWRRSTEPPPWLVPTRWKDYYTVKPGHWPEVEGLLGGGSLYLQDPGTRLAVELLDPRPGETVLDLCAAPGGKSLLIADTMSHGRLTCLDLPGARIGRLKENLALVEGVDVALVQADLLLGASGILAEHRLPSEYAAVLLDAPCSNTGVMRRRVDVKWRLQEGDFAKHARQQAELLAAAARLVTPRGRLVYSTCSVDAEENDRVVQGFLKRHQNFGLEKSAIAVPWIDCHDGAAAFLLKKA